MSLLTPVHALTVGLLLAAAAALAEGALRTRRRPARLVWVVALVLTATAPLWGPWLGSPTATVDSVPVALRMVDAPVGAADAGDGPASALAAMSAWVRSLDRPDGRVALAWLLAAALGLGLAGASLLRLHVRVARLPRGRVGGEEVCLAPDFGPACVGIARCRIVLPRWILGLMPRDLELVIRHERAHGAARDPLLLALGLVALASAPWNPALWWQVVRLRRAVELDCDARVLSSGASPSAYGQVLVRVLSRVRTGPFPAPALLDPISFLERRLTLMQQTRPGTWTRTLAAGALATGLVVVACETPAPTAVAPPEPAQGAQITEVPLDRSAATEAKLAAALQVPGIGALPEEVILVVDGVIVRGEALRTLKLEPARIASVEVVKGTATPLIKVTTLEPSQSDKTTSEVREVRPLRKDRLEQGQATLLEERAGPHPEALILIDGVRLEGGLAAVERMMAEDSDAIESVEVIKGEAARLLMGEEARHGVIRITTRKRGG